MTLAIVQIQKAVTDISAKLRLEGLGTDYVGLAHFSSPDKSAIEFNVTYWSQSDIYNFVYSIPWDFRTIIGTSDLNESVLL